MESSAVVADDVSTTLARSTVWLGDCWGSVDTATYEGGWPVHWISVSAGDGDAHGEHGAEVYLAPGYCLGDADYVYGSFDGAAAELLSADDWTPSGEVDADGDHWPSVCGDCDDADPEAYPDIYTTPYYGPDADCDGVTLAEDCDDSDAAVNPDRVEIPADGIDQDCTGADYVDADGDGFDANGDQDQEEFDCNDADPAINPDASDIHNDGIDQDCTGSDFIDEDGDWYDASDDDCDDHNPSVHPHTVEIHCNGLDDDCWRGDECDEDSADTGTGPSADTATADPPPPSGHRGCASAPARPSPSALLLLGLLAWRARRAPVRTPR
jgi:hypothetical protein